MATTLAERMSKFSGSPTSALIAKVAGTEAPGKGHYFPERGGARFWDP